MTIALAYVGVLTGAGLASGQEILQYFTPFGISGLWGTVIVAVLHAVLGLMVLQLGSYYQSEEHSVVLSQIASPILNKVLDWSLILTCFVIGFVMISGAGAALNQQFGLRPWIGAFICAVLIGTVGMMDFEKISAVIGSFTPIIVLFTLIAFLSAIRGNNINPEVSEKVTSTMNAALPNIWVSILNYFSLCFITGASMAFVLGGSAFRPVFAGRGGLTGGILTGLMGIFIAATLFLRAGDVVGSDIPMHVVINEINPLLGLILSITIFGMIFNTGLSLYYSLANRFSGKESKNFRPVLTGLCVSGFILSFAGFKKLVAVMYPLLGYIGWILIVTVVAAWLKERKNIRNEHRIRFSILDLMEKKHHKEKTLTLKEEIRLEKLIDNSNLENESIKSGLTERLTAEMETDSVETETSPIRNVS